MGDAEIKRGHPGGDVVVQAGKGELPSPGKLAGPAGSIRFLDAEKREVLRFDPDGAAFVHGVKVDHDPLVYAAFKVWLARATLLQAGEEG